MKINELCAAVWGAKEWLPRFRRNEYAGALREYQERFGPLYAQAVAETEGDLTALEALANDILDALEAAWKRRTFWNRGAVRVEEKQVVVSFLSPMLLDQPDPLCGRLAGMLRQGGALAQRQLSDHHGRNFAEGLPEQHPGHRPGGKAFEPGERPVKKLPEI